MAEQNKGGASEVLEKSASAASTIRGAIKTGKAVAAAAKGAAAGGPYGAVAGALWANRKHLGKIIIAVVAILLIPILFILMLPSLIFGGLINAFSPDKPDVPVINDPAAISENVSSVSFMVNGVLADGIEDVKLRINDDFSSSGCDRMEIIDPYNGNLRYSGNIFISQYCAAKDKDFESISLSDMENTLRGAKNHLYSFTKREETRETTVTEIDPETEEETTTTVSETWAIYTIVYNGEEYFADSVFHLSDEQKKLARDYAGNLSLFLDDGTYQYLADGEYSGFDLGDVTFTDGQTSVVYFNQTDSRWGGLPYGKSGTIASSACGPTAMAIVVSSLSGETVDPVQMSEWSVDNGYRAEGNGSYHSLIPAAAEEWGLPVEGCAASEPQRIVDALASGKLVVAIMSKGHFTSSGHFIVLRGVTSDGKILVADPASYTRSQKEWEMSIILKEASKGAGSGGPFWIIG